MALVKAPPKQPKTSSIQHRLDEETRTKLTQYAEFLDSSPSYVMSEAIKLLCRKDKEFQMWLSKQPHDIREASKGTTSPSES